MKKILSILLALAMILSLSIPAFAENETNTDGGSDPSQTVTTTGENSQDVTADYTPTPASVDDEAKWGASINELTMGSGTLAEAFEKAAGEPNIQYIQLQKSLTPTDGYSINGGSFTLDLNGCSITHANGTAIEVDNASSTITFADSKGTGKIVGSLAVDVYAGTASFSSGNYEGTSQYALFIRNGALATIDGGKFNTTSESESAVYNEGKLTINNGTFTNTKTGDDVASYVVDNSGTMTINGGSFSGAKYSAVAVYGKTTINGGTFVKGSDAEIAYWSGTLDLSKYNGTPALTSLTIYNENAPESEVTVSGTFTLPDGYGLSSDGTTTVEKLASGGHSIISTNGGSTTPDPDPTNPDPDPSIPTTDPEAKWGASANDLNIGSGTLKEAFTAAAGDPDIKYIQLQKSITPTEAYEINGGSFTLDLNGYSITHANGSVFDVNNASSTITFADSKGTGKVISGYPIYVYAGTVNFTGGNYEGTTGHTLNLKTGASATIIDGNFNNTCESAYVVFNEGTLIINNGTFTNTKTGNDVGRYVVVNRLGTMTINGGSFSGARWSAVLIQGTTTINGGTFVKGSDAEFGYWSDTLDLSGYDTTKLTDLTINNAKGDNVTVDGNIILPDGYGLSKDGTTTVEKLEHGAHSIISTKATITGVSIKVMNGENEVKPENSIYTITPDCTVTITVTGENLNNATSDYVVVVGKAYALTSEFGWTLSDGNKTATKTLSADAFTTCTSASEVKYTTNATAGDSVSYTQTGDRVIYQSPTSVEITWGAMSFYYDDEQDADGNDKGWMPTADGANTIKVENKGTTAIVPSVTYTPNDSFKDVITGTITADSNANWLENGQKKVYTLTLSGKPTAAFESTTIGKITVTIVENAGE